MRCSGVVRPDEGAVVHDDVEVVAPPAPGPGVVQQHVPPAVGGGHREPVTLTQQIFRISG